MMGFAADQAVIEDWNEDLGDRLHAVSITASTALDLLERAKSDLAYLIAGQQGGTFGGMNVHEMDEDDKRRRLSDAVESFELVNRFLSPAD